MGVLLEVRDLEVGYRGRRVLSEVSLHVNEGDFACLLGPSGCGKTTLLRAIAGFEPLHRGTVSLAGARVSAPGHTVPPERRRVGMVFQDNALFPHLTVERNVAFGLRDGGAAERARVVGDMLDLVGLQGLGGSYVHELSGGQQQRVALARALAPGPRLVLLDEPFSSLDVALRERLGAEVLAILKARGITAVLVTHDQGEAFALADQIGVMRDGALVQWDSAYNLYHEPCDRFVADFIGQGVFLRGRLVTPESIETELGLIRGNRAYPWPPGCDVDVLFRPDDIQPAANGGIAATVVSRAFRGASILYALRLATGSSVLALFPSHHDHAAGARVGIRVSADHLVAFPVP